MSNTILFPGWKHALENILQDIELNGYGTIFTHEKLKEWFAIKEPETIEEYKKNEFQYLQALEKLRYELLFEHCLYLHNTRGQGYQILTPDDQVDIGSERHVERARKELYKAQSALTNVKQELLSVEKTQLQTQKLAKIAFMRASFKAEIPQAKLKAIGDK